MASTPGTVLYPAALDDADSLIRVANNAASALAAPLTAAATTAALTSGAALPASGAITLLTGEILYYTGKSGDTLTGLVRGREGTAAAASAPAGTGVEQRRTARHHTVLADAIIATQTKLGVGASTPVAGAYLRGGATPGTSSWSSLLQADVLAALGYTPQDAASAATDAEIAAAVAPINAKLGGTAALGTLLVGTGAGTAAFQATSALTFTGGQLGINRAAPGAMLHAVASGAAVKGLIVQGAVSQSANLTEWQNTAGGALSAVNAAGGFGIAATAFTSWNLYVGGITSAGAGGIASFSGVIAGTTGTQYGLSTNASKSENSTGTLVGVGGKMGVAAAITLTTGIAVNAQFPAMGASAVLTNAYGLMVDNQNVAGVVNAYGIRVSNQTAGAAATNFAILTDGGQVRHDAGAAAVTPLVLRGAASQSANLTEWQNSSGTPLSYVGPTGRIVAKAGSDTTLAGGEGSFAVDGSNNVVIRSNASIILNTATLTQLAGGTALRFQGGNGTIDAYNGAATTLTLTNSSGSGRITEIVKAGSGQSTTNLTEWQNSSGTVLASIDPLGGLAVVPPSWVDTSGQRRGVQANVAINAPANSSATFRAVMGSLSTFGGAFNYTGSLSGGHFLVTHGSSGTLLAAYGVNATAATSAGAGNLTTALYGGYLSATHASASTLGAAVGLQTNMAASLSGGTITTAYGVLVTTPSVAAGAAIGTNYGLNIFNQGAAGITTAYGIRVAAQSGAGTNLALVTEGGTVRFAATGNKLEINDTGIGFFSATPTAKPAITGSRGGNAAVAALLTALATMGLLTDSTTA